MRQDMDRSREARKVLMAAPTGLSRRRHRGSGFRDSPDEEGAVEMQEAARLRDRKKKRERERERERDERPSRNKRRRGDRLIHAGTREDGPADSKGEEDYDDEGGGGGSLRMPPASTSSPLVSNHHLNHQPKSFPQSVPSMKIFRPAASPWKPADEMIGASIPCMKITLFPMYNVTTMTQDSSKT